MISLNDAAGQFTVYLKEQKKATATILAYRNDIAQLVKFLSGRGLTVVGSINQKLLEEFKDELSQKGYTPKSVSRKLNSIKTFFRFLKSKNLVEHNAAASLAHPKYEVKPPRILTKTEYRALRDACRSDNRTHAIVELMLQTGMRIGEVANLTLTDLTDKEIHVKPFESHEERTIPLNKAAKEALDQYMGQRPTVKSDTIFITKTGRPFLIRNIRSSIEKFLEVAEIKNAKVNDLRHTWIYHHLAAGTPLMLISKLAGHKRLSTTEKYLDLVKERKEGSSKLGEL